MEASLKPCCAVVEDQPLDEEALADTAALFKALADPSRAAIVELLAGASEPICVCDLEEHLPLSQPTVSHHLKVLTEAGLLDRRQEGRWAYYSLRSERLAQLRGRLEAWQG